MSTLRKFSKRHRKSDHLDAKTLVGAPLIDSQSIKEIQLTDAKTFALKRACRQRDKFTGECSRIKHRILSFCAWVMPGVTQCFEDPFNEVARAFYWQFTDPFKAKRAGIEGIRKKLEKTTGKKIEDSLLNDLYQKVLINCEFFESTEEYFSFEFATKEMHLNLESLKAMEKLRDKAAEVVRPLYKQVHPSKRVESLPGIAEKIGSAILGEVEDVSRFSSESDYLSFIGIVPKQNDSGQIVKKGLGMTHEGNSRLRHLYYEASDTARQWDCQLAKIYYEGMVYKGKSHREALVPVMAALANRTIAILRREEPYQFRDIEGNPISKRESKFLVKRSYTVPEEIRQRTRNRKRRKKEREKCSPNFKKRQSLTPHNWLENTPPEERIHFLREVVKSISPFIKISVLGGESKNHSQISKEQLLKNLT